MIDTDRIRKAGEYVEWLRIQIHEKEFPGTERVAAAAPCFSIAQDHHHAIVRLIEEQLYASAFALMRAAFEACVRGEWLALCATEGQVRHFVSGEEPPKIDKLVSQLEKTDAFSDGVLSRIKKQSWRTMCGFTHTGGLHVQRWIRADSIEASYGQEEVLEVLGFAEVIGSLAVLGFASLANDEGLAVRVFEQLKQRQG